MISKSGLCMILLAASGAAAADQMPKPGSYGFNWLKADSHCKKLTEKDFSQVKTCTESSNAFGLQLHSYACKVNAQTELMVYATAAQCQEALETMQANGP